MMGYEKMIRISKFDVTLKCDCHGSLSNSSSKLNLSRRHIALLRQIIITGNRMAKALKQLDSHILPKSALKLERRWTNLMVRLVNTT